jgi:hypothetical protein
MNYELAFANASQTSLRIHPYSSKISSSASSSSSSVFSVDATSSQTSESSQSSESSHTGLVNVTWDSEDQWRTSLRQDDIPRMVRKAAPPFKIEEPPVAPELRQNPRRCSISSNRGPPPLIRHSERKGQFVDSLVGKVTSDTYSIITFAKDNVCLENLQPKWLK